MSLRRKQLARASVVILSELKQLLNENEKNKKKVKRTIWVKPLLLNRMEYDLESHLLKDLLWAEDKDFRNFTRLNIHEFEEILGLVYARLKKKDLKARESITPRVKLAIVLRYIATGDSYKSMEFLSRVSASTISVFIPQVLRAIYKALQPTYLKVPSTEQEWMEISHHFHQIWNFPHTLGALDGKHVKIKAPANSGSQFYNFKGFYSIVLFALVDAHCRFIYVDVGANGKSSDSTIYSDGYLYRALKNQTLNIPPESELVTSKTTKLPYFFVGDDAFPLDKNLMKPFNRNSKLSTAEEIFNYRLCRARMSAECAFGKLTNRFRIFHRPIEVLPNTVDQIVLCCCALHNFLSKVLTTQPTINDQNLDPLPNTFSSLGPQQCATYKYACRVRNELKNFLITDGNVDFQWGKLNHRSDISNNK